MLKIFDQGLSSPRAALPTSERRARREIGRPRCSTQRLLLLLLRMRCASRDIPRSLGGWRGEGEIVVRFGVCVLKGKNKGREGQAGLSHAPSRVSVENYLTNEVRCFARPKPRGKERVQDNVFIKRVIFCFSPQQ